MATSFRERWAARKNPRFRAFVEGKDAYDAFVQDQRVPLEVRSTEHERLARGDSRLALAEARFRTAIELSEAENAPADAAVARFQLGGVYQMRGQIDEATALIHAALQVLSTVPAESRAANMRECEFLLGVISLRRGRPADAVPALRRARDIDAANGDLPGLRHCERLLEACAAAGADVEADVRSPAEHRPIWNLPENLGESSDTPEASGAVVNSLAPVRFDQRQVIWLASYSPQANDAVMTQVEKLGSEFGRPIEVSRVAFGATERAYRRLELPAPDQHLCAAILVIERQGLGDKGFRSLANECVQRVVAVPDFRLLVYLHDLSIDELRTLREDDDFIDSLFDTTQIAEVPSLTQLRASLVPHVRRVERIRRSALWRNIRLTSVSWCGIFAEALLVTVALASWLGLMGLLLGARFDWLGPAAPVLASLCAGILAFPMQAPLIFLLLRGWHKNLQLYQESVKLRRWVILCESVLLVANILQNRISGPIGWVILGVVVGVLLDAIRRAGVLARRQMIDLNSLRESQASASVLRHPEFTVMRGDRLNPFSCPLLPTVSARVFISYAPSSAKASRLARALYRRLRGVGASPFLDRVSIPVGMSWRRSLNEQLGECDSFVCILDEIGVQRHWVAAELLAALDGRSLSANPQIVILVDPAVIQRPSPTILPIFQGVIAAASQPPVTGRPQIMELNDQALSSLVWGLTPGRFVPISVFSRPVALAWVACSTLFFFLGSLGILAGWLLGFAAMLEMTAKLPFTTGVAAHGLLAPMTIVTGFWTGYTARATIAWEFERDHDSQMGPVMPSMAIVGLVYVLVLSAASVSALTLAWALVLFGVGWMLVAWGVRTEETQRVGTPAT